ncbi:MAG: peptidylprolyl isomerase [Deltaproteobacteria bacterium]|nr:peptidylprolyl isomerase [Deltaproteobacteria bacterium]
MTAVRRLNGSKARLERVLRGAALAAVAALASAVPAHAAGPASSGVIERIAATVGPEPILMSEVRRSAEIVAKASGNPQPIDDAMLGKELDGLIEREILRQHMRKVGISVSDAEVQDALEGMLGRSGVKPDQIDAMLDKQGLSKEEYRDRIRAELERRRVVDVEVRPRVVVEEADIQKYYAEHKGELSVAERVHLRDIYLPYPPLASAEDKAEVMAKAKEIKASAVADPSIFGNLAKRFSKGPGAEEGGDLGVFERGKLRAELEEAAFALGEGEIGGPVESGGGLHVLQVEEKLAGGAPPLDQVKSSIREKLLATALERTYRRWYERLLEEAHVARKVDLPSEFKLGPTGPVTSGAQPATGGSTATVPDAPKDPVTPAPDDPTAPVP